MPIRVPVERVRAYAFARQRLAQRPHLDPARPDAGVLAIVADCGPVRARPVLSTYLSLWARADGFEREALDTALYRERTLVRIPGMHARLFLVPSADLPAYFQTNRPILGAGLEGYVNGLLADAVPDGGAAAGDAAVLVPRILEILSARGPSTTQELAEFLPSLSAPLATNTEARTPPLRLGQQLIPALCVQGVLVRAETRGGWRSDQFAYAPLSAWLPGLRLDAIGPDEALRRMVLAYLTAFGPASIGDVYQWLGGPRRQRVAAALMHLGDRLARVQIAGQAGEYAMVREHLDAMFAFQQERRAIALLPPRDSYVMAYSDTSRFLAPAYRERVFDRVGEPYGTVWLDGVISGIWNVHLREERIVVRLFEPLDPEALGLLDEETRRLGRFLEFRALDVVVGIDEADEDDQATVAVPSVVVGR